MKCPLKFTEEVDWASVHGEDHDKVGNCIEEKCAWWLKTPGACAKKVQAMQTLQIAQQLISTNVHLSQMLEALRSISQGVYP